MVYEPTLVTAPVAWPVTVDEAKKNSRIHHSDDDELIGDLIGAACELLEDEIPGGKQLMPATFDYVLPRFASPKGMIQLPKPPLTEVTWVKYYDQANTLQTLDTDSYHVVTHSNKPGYLYPAKDQTWPSTEPQRADAVQIRFTAGYASAEAVPSRAKQAIKLLVAHWYEHPEAVGSVGPEIELAYRSLANSLGWGGGFI